MSKWLKINWFVLFCLSCLSVQAQIVDVFENRLYDVTGQSFKLDPTIDYLKESQISIRLPDIEETAREKIAQQIESLIRQELEEELNFFKLHQAVQSKLKIFKETAYDSRNQSPSNYSIPEFDRVDTRLISVVHSYAVLKIDFKFETDNLNDYRSTKRIQISQYYLVDLKTNQVKEIPQKHSDAQQETLKELTLSEIRKLYLLKTEKYQLDELQKIRELSSEEVTDQNFIDQIDYSEALIYPYATGIIMEFPNYSKTSKIFSGEDFRVFIHDEQLKSFTASFPMFQPLFSKKTPPTNPKTLENLKPENFDLSFLQQGPEQEKALELLDLNRKIYKLDIKTYQKVADSFSLYQTETYKFNPQNKIETIETRNRERQLFQEKRFYYDKDGILSEEISLNNDRKYPVLYHYHNNQLKYAEYYQTDPYSSHYNIGEPNRIEAWQQHYFVNENFYYNFKIVSFGEMPTPYIYTHWQEEDKICNLNYCILHNEDGQVIGITHKKSDATEVFNNEKGQVKESYNNRNHYFFEYDNQDRLYQIHSYDTNKFTNTTTYHYSPTEQTILSIEKSKDNTKQDYQIQYWDWEVEP